MLDVDIKEVSADVVRPLRTEVLRPHFTGDELAEFEGDGAEDTHHFVIRKRDGGGEGDVLGVISYMRAEPPEDVPVGEAGAAWRLRGMAVAETCQGDGLGGRLLETSLGRMQVLEPEISLVWCNARTSAADFYEGHGFERRGEVFEVPEIGPHVIMSKRVLGALA